jgi:hypothetical protein
MRSVHFGCSRYSRRCHLFRDLSFYRSMEGRPGQVLSCRNSAFGCGAFNFSTELCRHELAFATVVERLVLLATDTVMM